MEKLHGESRVLSLLMQDDETGMGSVSSEHNSVVELSEFRHIAGSDISSPVFTPTTPQRADRLRQAHNKINNVYMAMSENGVIVDAMLSCSPARQDILVLIACETSVEYLASLKIFLQALSVDEYFVAARELLNTGWAEQDHRRAWLYASVLMSESWDTGTVSE